MVPPAKLLSADSVSVPGPDLISAPPPTFVPFHVSVAPPPATLNVAPPLAKVAPRSTVTEPPLYWSVLL